MEDTGESAETRKHWELIYARHQPDGVSWYEAYPDASLDLIIGCASPATAAIIDVGGGASTLIDHLLDAGYGDVTVLDVTEAGPAAARKRLGERASSVSWIVADVRHFRPERRWTLWHDRAVFHFLTVPEDRLAYRDALRRSVEPGGSAILATFGSDGPTRCSGLDVCRYTARGLEAELGPGLELVEHELHVHLTPTGAEQQFLYARLVRGG